MRDSGARDRQQDSWIHRVALPLALYLATAFAGWFAGAVSTLNTLVMRVGSLEEHAQLDKEHEAEDRARFAMDDRRDAAQDARISAIEARNKVIDERNLK